MLKKVGLKSTGTGSQKKEPKKCPGCEKSLPEYTPEYGGTVTDPKENRWHHSCFFSQNK